MRKVWIHRFVPYLTVFCIGIIISVLLFGPAVAAQEAEPSEPAKAPDPAMWRGDVTAVDAEYLKAYHEEWTAITLQKSYLKAGVPILGEKDDVESKSFIRERYQLIWRPGDPIDVYVIRPRGVKKPAVVLFLYSYPQDTDRFKDDGWCAGIASQGYAAVGFVSELTGHRSEHHPMKDTFISKLQESLAATTHDVQMILNYLETRDDLDTKRVGMFGQGSGGAVAILASAADPRIKALDVLDPWGDWPDWLAKTPAIKSESRSTYTTPEFLAAVAPLDPTRWLSKVKAQSVRIQDIRTDPLVPEISQEAIEKEAPNRAEVNQFGDSVAFYPVGAGGQMFRWFATQFDPRTVQSVLDDSAPHVHIYPAKGKSIDSKSN